MIDREKIFSHGLYGFTQIKRKKKKEKRILALYSIQNTLAFDFRF